MHDKLKLLLIAAFLFYLLPYFIADQIFIPDELDYRFFGNLLAEEGKLSFVSSSDDMFGLKGFIPRHFTYNRFGEVVPQGFQGFILLLALFYVLLPDPLIFIINPLLAVLVLLLAYKISYEILADRSSAVWAAAFLATTPIFIHWTNFYMPDLLNVTLFLAAFFCLLKAFHNEHFYYYLGFGICSGFLYWVRYTSVLLLLPLLALILVRRNQLHSGKILFSLGLSLVIIGIALVYHYRVYGTMFERRENTHIIAYLLTDHTKEHAQESLVPKLKFATLWSHLKTIPATFSLAYPPFFLGLLGLVIGWRSHPNAKNFVFFFIVLSLVSIPFFANFHTYGTSSGDITLHSSFLRYLLPVFALLPIATAITLSSLKGPVVRIAALISIVNLSVAVIGPHGVVESTVSKRYFQKTAEFILRSTDEHTVIISSYWDKIVFPQRITYGHVSQLTQPAFEALLKNIASTGFKITYIDHTYNGKTLNHLQGGHHSVKHIQGPSLESGFFRVIRDFIPSELYPVNMYLIEVINSHREDGQGLPESMTESPSA